MFISCIIWFLIKFINKKYIRISIQGTQWQTLPTVIFYQASIVTSLN